MILAASISCFLIGFLLGQLKYLELVRANQRDKSRRNHPSYQGDNNFRFDTNFWIQKSGGDDD